MAMLAERRSKGQWSADPRNTFWSKDRSKFGYRMLERMGWSEGRGLGVNEDGQETPVKLQLKKDSSGLGAKKTRDDDWIAQQDSFDQVLSELNEIQGAKEDDSIESKKLVSTAQKTKKLLYKKFLRSKDLSSKTDEDMACVLGRKKRKRDESPQPVLDNAVAVEDDSGVVEVQHGFPTIKNSLSVQDYFADKMRRLKQKSKEKEAEEPEALVKKKKRKERRKEHDETEEAVKERTETVKASKRKDKKRKQSKHCMN